MERRAEILRKTNETEVGIGLNLDGEGLYRGDTGIPFLDHMLAQLAVHGLMNLDVRARGDWQVDAHHTVEDVGITLGQAMDRALGEKGGINRSASAYMPMDETLAFVALDFSGRPYAIVQVDWKSPAVGGIPTSVITHFWESFAFQARCTLHVHVLYGRDDHHQAEAVFKALGRAISQAVQVDPRRGGKIASSKGVL